MASLTLQLLLLALFVIVCILPFTSTAPQAWRPQGRFGKRAAWRPQSRFGKRPSSSAFLSGRDGGPKRAWRPSSRFGKRDDDNSDTETSFEGRFEDIGALKRAWKPQGRFGKRMDEEMDLMETNSEEKRAWKPQGRFGKRLLRTQRWRNVIEALKRAWKPQGRFGKRADLSAEDEEQGMNIVFVFVSLQIYCLECESGRIENMPHSNCSRLDKYEDVFRNWTAFPAVKS